MSLQKWRSWQLFNNSLLSFEILLVDFFIVVDRFEVRLCAPEHLLPAVVENLPDCDADNDETGHQEKINFDDVLP